jgi:RNA polymerase sigma factor (sigma-70 family)
VSATDSTAAIEAVYRIEFPRVVATLAHHVGDIGLAEDLAQEALVDALRQWPRDGTPANPGAWLTAVGKRKAIDLFRRDRTLAAKYAQVGRALESEGRDAVATPTDIAFEEEIQDDQLRLIFVACHPLLPVPARVALTLRLVGGLTVPEIARAYVVPEPTVAQRIVRAKKAITRAGVPFEVPIARPGSAPCSRSSTSSSTRATRPPRARTGCARSSVRRRSGWAASWPPWRPRRPRSTGWLR